MSFKKQIMSNASFLHQIEAIVFITIEVFFTSYSVLKIGEDHFTFWGVYFPVLDGLYSVTRNIKTYQIIA